MKKFYKYLIKRFNLGTPCGEKLHQTAITCLGTDASPNDKAPDEYGCAETVNDIIYMAFEDYAGGDVSTYRMYLGIKNNPKFLRVEKPIQGDIILSPTGYGNKSKVSNGHVGIVGYDGDVMSNDSKTGKFKINYTIESWTKRYKNKGEYPIYYYRRVFKN